MVLRRLLKFSRAGIGRHDVRSGLSARRKMRVREFEADLWLPQPRADVFGFFSDAANLDLITPPWVNFQMITRLPIEMHVGTLIDYKLRIHGLPVRWRSKITVWEPPVRFVDEQLRGPYQLWIHEHTFAERDGGTLICDRVQYAVPFDCLAYPLLVRGDVKRIFRYRSDTLRRRFAVPA
jgi:ligand-binding SRPBCC domain-containing protein